MRFTLCTIVAVSVLSAGAAGSAFAEGCKSCANPKLKTVRLQKPSPPKNPRTASRSKDCYSSNCSKKSCHGSDCSEKSCGSGCSKCSGCSKGSCYSKNSKSCSCHASGGFRVCPACGTRGTCGPDGRCRRCGACCGGHGCVGGYCGRRHQSHRYGTNGPGCWHNGYAYTPWGVPAALVVPPTVDWVTNWGWGVGNTRITPIYAQFGPNWPGTMTTIVEGGDSTGGQPRYLTTPPQPSDTTQFGVNYVRGPW